MNKDTNTATLYIVLFFAGILVISGMFFAYKIFIDTPEKNNIEIADEEFDNIIKQKEKLIYFE